MVKTLKKSSSLEPKVQWPWAFVCSNGAKWCHWVDLDLFYGKVKSGPLCFYMGKSARKSFNGRNLQQMTRVTKGLYLIKILTPGDCLPLPQGYIHVWKPEKLCIKSDFKDLTCNKWAKWQGFSVDIRILSIKGCLPLPRGYIHVEKH